MVPKISLRRGGASSFAVSMGGGLMVVVKSASSTALLMSKSWLSEPEPVRNPFTLDAAAASKAATADAARGESWREHLLENLAAQSSFVCASALL